MADDNDKKPQINPELEDALKEFEESGGFTDAAPQDNKSQGSSNSKPPQSSDDDFDDDFGDFLSDIPEDLPSAKQKNQNATQHQYDDNDEIEHADDDHEIHMDDDFADSSDDGSIPPTKGNNNKDKKGGGKGGGGGFDVIIEKLKQPKNLVIFIIAVCFILFLILQSGSKKKKVEYQSRKEVHEEVLSDISDIQKDNADTKQRDIKYDNIPEPSLQDIELPNLDIELPNIHRSNVELLPSIPQPKIPEPKQPDPLPPEIPKQEIIIPEPKEPKPALPEVPDVEDAKAEDIVATKTRKPVLDKQKLKPLVQDFTDNVKVPSKTTDQKSRDFIFVDTDLDTEVEENKITAKRLESPENVVSQGRIIDAVLETAIDSTIGGQVRAIITRDVYGEVGRNILIPKGTRLYGEYGGASDAAKGGRIIITWTRIMRPDNISASINSFASDQFGRSGIEGEVDKKYFNNITASLLLSTIPLVTTIMTNAVTNQNPQTTNVGPQGNMTIIQDPINIATQSFTRNVSKMTSDIIQKIADTKPTVTLNQGTRIKILVNQDIKLPSYKPITRAQTGVSAKSG